MVRVLAVSDEVVDALWRPTARALAPDLVVACGDLPFDYLDYLQTTLGAPLAFVPGNHDPDLSGRDRPPRDPWTCPPGPPGAVNVDGTVADLAGLRVAGLGGCLRYRPGPNQYTDHQQRARARRLARRARRRHARDGRHVDLLLTHAPPRGLGDGQDRPHHGFTALYRLVDRLAPTYLLHGHVHPYGQHAPDRTMAAGTVVCNVVGYRTVEVHPRP